MKFSLFNKKRQPASGDVSLNITAMADIFTILLVFLLKSFSTGVLSITPSTGLTLPQAQADEASIEALKVEISENAIVVENKPVTPLQAFNFNSKDVESNGALKSLDDALKIERKRQMVIAKANSDVKVDPKIIVIADQKTPYSTIKAVLASAAVNGYTDFKLAVIKDGS